MKKQRRLLAALLALNLVLGLAAPCAAAGDSTAEPSTQAETPKQTGTETAPEATADPEPTPDPEPIPDPEPTSDPEVPADTENPGTDPQTPGTGPENPVTDLENPGTDTENPDTTPETPDNPSENPDTPPETPTTPTEPADPIVPPPPTQEELDAAQKAQEEAAEREALLSQLRELLPEEEQAALETMSLEELRALKASLDEEQEKEELIQRLREILPDEDQTSLDTMSLEELRTALSQAEAEAEEARVEAERQSLLEQLKTLLPEEDPAVWNGLTPEELRSALAQAEAERQAIIRDLKDFLPEEDHAELEELSLSELRQYRKMLLEERPMLLSNAAVLEVTIQTPPPIQINPYGLSIGGSTASLISQPCLITSNTQAEVKVTATATAVATGGAKLMKQSTRSGDAMAAHKTDERDIFLFLELKNLAGSDASAADWTTDPVNFLASESAAVIPRNGEGIAKLTIPAASGPDAPSYAAFKIGGDCSKPSYMGEWGSTDVDGTLVDDGAKITIVFTFTVQEFYNVRFVVEPFELDEKIINPDQIFVTAGGEKVSLTPTMVNDVCVGLQSEPEQEVQALAGKDFVFHVQSSIPPTENHTYFSAFFKVTADAADGSYSKQLFYVYGGDEKAAVSKPFTLEASTVPVGADITITITVYMRYYSV